MIGRIFRRFFTDLINGDTTAWVVLAIIAGVFALFSLLWIKVAYDFRREEKQKKEKYRRRERDEAKTSRRQRE